MIHYHWPNRDPEAPTWPQWQAVARSDVVVSNELRSGLLVKAHPLALPGHGFYLVSMPHSPRAADIEAFSTWMRGIG